MVRRVAKGLPTYKMTGGKVRVLFPITRDSATVIKKLCV